MPPARKPFFPPRPARFVGRSGELRAIRARLASGIDRLALVGGGGTGKSLLACALGHRIRAQYPGGAHWFRVGAWGTTTLFEMLARRLGLHSGDRRDAIVEHLSARGRTLIVLDNHENDRALARFLEALRPCPVTWIVTARRCLLAGVEIYPVVPPLVSTGRSAFSRVAPLTKLLRWNPLALDIADRLVATGHATVNRLAAFLREGGVEKIAVMSNEDDVAEVRLLVDYVWPRLPAAARAMLAALAHTEGDDTGTDSLRHLARAGGKGPNSLALLRRLHLVQEPLAERFTLHAVVRQAVAARTQFPADRYFQHYVRLLESDP
ncbi:MAG TPA: hypothetical protein VGF45_08065, partial [Polyangia bacterium]